MRTRLLIKVICDGCGKEYERYKHHYDLAVKLHQKQYCGKECKRKSQFKGKLIACFTCGKEIYITPSQSRRSKSGDNFCSKHCATIVNNSRHKKWTNHPHYKNGINAYRAKALEYYPNVCSNLNCPLTHISIPIKMLDVHHLDKNRENNDLSNLKILCVWCHAFETRKYQE